MEMDGSGFKPQKRPMTGSTSDRISHLPWDVLQRVLVCLGVQYAARTSVLSRKWRYIWTELPELIFNDTFCRRLVSRATTTRATTDKLMLTIYKVLLLHQGPILKFTLAVKLVSCPEIDLVIFFVSKNGIRQLTLHIREGEPYKLPSMLFSCLQLEHLNLHSCVFKPPPGFKGFTNLVSLELHKVFIAGDVLSSLISSCPLLERLTLHNSTSFDFLEIVAPKLKQLLCQGHYRAVCFRIPSEIVDFSVGMEGSRNQLEFNGGEICNSAKLLGSLPIVEFLALDYQYVRSMAARGVRERLPTTLNCLVYVQLYDICFGELDEVSTVLYLIRSSPNLQQIFIRAFHGATAAIEPVVELFDLQGWSDVSLNKLLFVDMEKVSGTKAEMEFIKLLLAKSPRLHTMGIKLKLKECVEESLIVKELSGCRRASTRAIITFPK